MPIERGDSWFSPKCIEVQPWYILLAEVEHCCCKGASPLTERRQTPNAAISFPRVRQWVLTFIVKRETTQTCC